MIASVEGGSSSFTSLSSGVSCSCCASFVPSIEGSWFSSSFSSCGSGVSGSCCASSSISDCVLSRLLRRLFFFFFFFFLLLPASASVGLAAASRCGSGSASAFTSTAGGATSDCVSSMGASRVNVRGSAQFGVWFAVRTLGRRYALKLRVARP